MKVLRAADHRGMPWKNGGGTTTEIAVWPPHAGMDDFLWRVSMARVEAAGPFSRFPGIDRSLVVLNGAGLVLAMPAAEPVRLTRQSEPLRFAADLPTKAELIDGPITDLNVMSRRGRVDHSLSVIEPEGLLEIAIDAPQALLFCAEGAVRATSETGEAGLLEGLDALMLDPAPRRLTICAARPARICIVQLRPAPERAPER